MTLDNDKARELFNAARNLPSAEREPFLDKECGEDDAEVYYTEALEGTRRILGDEHPTTLETINSLVELYEVWEKPEEAQKYRDMLPEEDTTVQDSEP